MTSLFRPMLAENWDKDKVLARLANQELYVETKYNGVRVTVIKKDGKIHVQSRSGKPFANRWLTAFLRKLPWAEGIHDGELVVGKYPCSQSQHNTTSFISRNMISPEIAPAIRIFLWRYPDDFKPNKHTILVERHTVTSLADIFLRFNEAQREGHEGIVIKSGVYKNGRSTKLELMRLVPYNTIDGTIKAIEPAYTNTNSATKNALGYTERSTCQDGLVESDMMGSMTVLLENGDIVRVGTFRGLSHDDRREILKNSQAYINSVVELGYVERKLVKSSYVYTSLRFIGFRPDKS